jgi:hypothetical protein
MVTKETIDAVVKDRSAIVQNAINTKCAAGRMTSTFRNSMNTFANLVFYEPGWHWEIREQTNGRPDFVVRAYTPEN